MEKSIFLLLLFLILMAFAGCDNQDARKEHVSTVNNTPDAFTQITTIEHNSTMVEDNIIQLIKDQYPKFKNFPGSTPGGGTIRAKKIFDMQAVLFITHGSGLPIVGTDCFMVENGKVTKVEGSNQKTENDKAVYTECETLLHEEEKKFSKN